MNWSILTIIALCALVNFFIRIFPWLIAKSEKIPQSIRRFLTILPTAALGALIFPGSWNALEATGRPWAALGGLGAAALTAHFSKNLIVPVSASVLVTWVMLNLPL